MTFAVESTTTIADVQAAAELAAGAGPVMSLAQAREVTADIKRTGSVMWSQITKAFKGRVWVPLAYESWDAYCEGEFDGARLKLPREERTMVVASLADAGMSTRAIAAATGLGKSTVDRALSGVPNGTPDASSEVEKPVPASSGGDADDDIVDAEVVEDTTPTPRKVTGVDGKTYTLTPKPATGGEGTQEDTATTGAALEPVHPQRLGHPATFSRAVLAMIGDYLQVGDSVLDPFAGVGTIHELADRLRVETFGVELEAEWAEMHPRTVCADARQLAEIFEDQFDVIATSPAYGNRMADHHEAADGSHRWTYRHMLGRQLSEGSSAAMQWGREYRDLHAEVWGQCVTVLRDYGLLILNIKDHVRGGEVQHVAAWHVDHLCRVLGLRLVAHHVIPGAGLPAGENEDLRVVGEEIYVFEKQESELEEVS